MGGRDGDLGYLKALWQSGKICSPYFRYSTDAGSPTRVFVFFSLFQDIMPSGLTVHRVLIAPRDRNKDYTGMGASGSTDLMAGKVMFLRSNQGGRLDGNESVEDSFRSDLVGFKSWSGRIIGAYTPIDTCH
ncbi:hypothetical protein TNCV_4477291 [Trichonephila clavipes]|nr:hypothetical protein TNCV_4477291 [Trichonephila clavipes]